MKKAILYSAMAMVMSAFNAQVVNAQENSSIPVTDAVKVANIMSVAHKPGCNKGVPYADSEGNFTGGKVWNHGGVYVIGGGGIAHDGGKSDIHGDMNATRGMLEAGLGFEYHKEGWFASPFAEVYGGGLFGGDSDFAFMGGARAGAFFNPCGKVRPGLALDARFQNQKDTAEGATFQSHKLVLGVRGYLDIQVATLKTTKWSDGYPIEQYRPMTLRVFAGILFDQLGQPHDEAVGPQLRKWNNTRFEAGLVLCFRSL